MKRTLILTLLALSLLTAQAQTGHSWEDYFNSMGQLEDTETGAWEETYDELSEEAANPLDLNTCTREDLERLPFLSGQQVMDLMEYRDRYGRLESTGELLMIPSLDWHTREMLLHFVTIRPDTSRDSIPSLSSLFRHGKSEMVGTFRLPFYSRKGDRNGYLGYKYKHWLRYTYSCGQWLKAGLVASQDAGEPFFSGKNSLGYDYYSFYFLLRNRHRLKALALGRYRLRFGMGLAMNTSFSLGKLATLSTLGRTTNNILAHSSRSEAYYLQGAAATIRVARGLDVTPFFSWRKIDATLTDDSRGVRTILTSGYHRTPSEMDRRRNVSQTVAGGNVNYFNHGFHAGVTAFHAGFSLPLEPSRSQRYRRWRPEGKNFWNGSVDYGYLSRRLTIAGETATGSCGHLATLNSISFLASSQLSVMVLQRFYAYQYSSLFSNSFSEGGDVQNESGIYLGANYTPSRSLNILFYTDYSYFAWDRYLTLAGSHCWDNLLSCIWSHGNWRAQARYRLRMKERDNAKHTALVYKNEHRGRLALDYTSPRWQLRTQGDLAYCAFDDTSLGWMLTQSAGLHWHRLQAFGSVGYFHTDDYNSRVYTYERSVMYTFSFPSFSGEGIHYALNVRADITPRLMLMARLSTTDYFDRSSISSGLQEIDRSSQTDLELQIRWKF